MKEYEYEPEPGLPEPLPTGESILWQGAPSWYGLLIHALHVRWVLVYFFMLGAWRGVDDIGAGASVAEAVASGSMVVLVGLVPVGILALYAWLTARTSLYTVTTKRIVMRFGLALPVVLNLPFGKIATADLACHSDGTGDIPLSPVKGPEAGAPVSYLFVWPHVRPWQLSHAQPMLRCIREPERVAGILAAALKASGPSPRGIVGVVPGGVSAAGRAEAIRPMPSAVATAV